MRIEVDAIHKNIDVKDFGEGAAFGSLIEIPFDDIISAGRLLCRWAMITDNRWGHALI
jgi:hypothetical protein